jgi:hypothetical protein
VARWPSQSAESDSEYASKFGYPTVASALADLKARPNVSISIQGGRTIIDDKANWTLWSFTPSNHPAHPAGVKRVILRDAESNVYIRMTALCQAEKEPCDKLVAQFQALNDRIKDIAAGSMLVITYATGNRLTWQHVRIYLILAATAVAARQNRPSRRNE